ncbi:MAG: Nif3-like dinuclear metal center hexameric protein [Deltaproteobacteria bacterium]|nr:Nif3-like dinuclear metal center hexameric protein [Deltaproteobacteria bacterium]
MAAKLEDIVRHLDGLLEVHLFKDYGPNGLQVQGRGEVQRIATGVSATLAFLERAAEMDADLVVVHHGLIWGKGIERVTGVTARRLGFLLSRGMSLLGYHLPLDKHGQLGNNAGLADALGLPMERRSFGDVGGQDLGIYADLEAPVSLAELVLRVENRVLRGEAARFVFPYGPPTVRRVGLCSGAAGDFVEAARNAGCDAYVTGELAERAGELARELGISLIAAGHHATEIFGPRRLADHLRNAFPSVQVEFFDVPSPL